VTEDQQRWLGGKPSHRDWLLTELGELHPLSDRLRLGVDNHLPLRLVLPPIAAARADNVDAADSSARDGLNRTTLQGRHLKTPIGHFGEGHIGDEARQHRGLV
jgi:hypothetical protein